MKRKTKLKIALFGLIVIPLSVMLIQGLMENQTAKEGNKVSVDYWLTVDGKQIDTSEGRGEFEFTVGAGQVIPGFDKTVTGMSVGEEKTVELSGKDAYTAGPLAGKTLTFKIILRDIA